MFARGAPVLASALALAPVSWKQGSSARRHRALGQRLVYVWTTLDPHEKEELRGFLAIPQRAGKQI